MSAYNCQDTIGEAIESVLDQTYSNFEFIIADDGSSDKTRDIIDLFEKRDQRIHCFHNHQNLGLLHTWNHLLTKATGDLIAWQDADDYSYPQRLEKMVHAFEDDPELMICGSNYVRILKPWRIILTSNYPTDYGTLLQSIHTQNKLLFLGGSRMIRRTLLADFPEFRTFFNRIGWEDKDYILRVAEKHKVINLPDALYEYRYSRHSASRTLLEEGYLKLFAEEIGFFLAKQRWRDGVDGLMQGGNKEEFDNYLAGLKSYFEQDKSILYRRACVNKINNRDYLYAFHDAFHAIGKNLTSIDNYRLLFRIIGSFTLTFYKRLSRNY